MKTFHLPILVSLLLTANFLTAQVTNNLQQPTSINTDGAAPAASAMLDVSATDRGMLVPRMTTAQRTAIASPATGLLVFDTTTGGFWFYSGTAWTNLSATPKTLADADNDTKIQVEENPDEDIIRMDIAGTERLKILKNNATGNHTMIELPNNGSNTYLGLSAGLASTTGSQNTFIGSAAGTKVVTGEYNTILGSFAGINTIGGSSNTFLGQGAGNLNVSGSSNTYLGREAGFNNTTGSGNIFLGFQAGFSETGSNRLYIDNSNTSSPLIWGDFANNLVNFNGDVCVGTTTPEADLTVAGGLRANSLGVRHGTTNVRTMTMFGGTTGDQWINFRRGGNPTGNAGLIFSDHSNEHYFMYTDGDFLHLKYSTQASDDPNVTNAVPRLRIRNDDGRVAIGDNGSNDVFATGYKLSVVGKIACEEVMVDLNGDWPDYVFQEDYDLKSLTEVKRFIDENGHLPGVPSATEVEENGVILGEMNKVLMEKIEELTLYILQQDERIKALENIRKQ